MIRPKILIAFLIITIGVIIFIYSYSLVDINETPNFITITDPQPGKVEKIGYVVVKSAFMNPSNILKPNAALLITEKQEINKLQELFLAKQSISHLCGYDYSIQFWKNADSLFDVVSLNTNCETFNYKPQETHQQLEQLVQKLETSPTHYIYNLELSVSTTPESLKAKLTNSGKNLFFIENPSSRFPKIIFSHRLNSFVGKYAGQKKWKNAEYENKKHSENIIRTIIEKVEKVSTVLEQSDIYYDSYGCTGDSVTHNGIVELRFKLGTNLPKIVNLIKEQGANVTYSNVPKFYNIQLIDTQSNLDSVKLKMKKYKIVQNVTEYEE